MNKELKNIEDKITELLEIPDILNLQHSNLIVLFSSIGNSIEELKKELINKDGIIDSFKEYIFLKEVLSCDYKYRLKYYNFVKDRDIKKDNIRLKQLEKELDIFELQKLFKEEIK